MLYKLKNLIIGTPLPTYQLSEKRLNKIRALAAFSPDALSSIAYANQEIYLGLVIAGSAGMMMAWPIGLAIIGLLVIVTFSYYQTIQAYPSGGGSYIVARDNLGRFPGLVAAAALLVDYVLVAAVSLSAGVEAIASAFPILWGYRVVIALGILLILMIINLRGLRETGTIMAIPVYFFLFTYIPMLAIGFFQLMRGGAIEIQAAALPASQPLTLLLLLHTFSSGCTALTGVEAISNGVPAFQQPASKNAGKTLVIMAVLMGILFIGSIGLTQFLGVVAGENETILSALAHRILGNGFAYYVIQTATLLVLAVAANTSFADFPRVAAILANDGFLPRQMAGLGDRLVFNNGIILLSIFAGILIVAFRGDTHSLIPLFAIGAFLAFTLSQAGMVRHWWRLRGTNWKQKLLANALGAFGTAITLSVIAFSKFTSGAWLTFIIIPSIIFIFLKIRNHYEIVRKQLSLHGLPPSLRPYPTPRVVIPISGIHRGTIEAVDFARGITRNVVGVFIEFEPGSGEQIRREWDRWFPDITLEIRQSPYRSVIGPLLEFLDETDRIHNDGQLAVVVLPEFVPAKWWQAILHNQTSWLIKTALLYRRRELGYQRAIIDVPYHLRK